jgi:hypothetical protein
MVINFMSELSFTTKERVKREIFLPTNDDDDDFN